MLPDLRSGLDTLLTSEWFGGRQLSGGQWQRVVLTRAFHRQAALLVMAEPTASPTSPWPWPWPWPWPTGSSSSTRGASFRKGHAGLIREPGLFRMLWQLEQRTGGKVSRPS